MKNILKLFILLFVVGSMSSCEPDEYDVPNIDLTPVYNLTETGNDSLEIINIYKEESLLTVWDKDGIVTTSLTSDYVDSTDSVDYNVTLIGTLEETKITEEDIDENIVASTIEDITSVTDYVLTGVIAEGTAQLEMSTTVTTISTTTLIITDDEGNITEEPQEPVETTTNTEDVVSGIISNEEVYI